MADGARRYGNGQIELTNRANFQIRGITPPDEDALIQHLLDAGLGPKDAQADDIRNVMVSATLGLDSTAIVDVSDLAAQILAFVEGDERIHALSPKLSILVDGGEVGSPADHPSDLWLSAMADGLFAFGYASRPPMSDQDPAPLGAIHADHAFDLVVASLEAFVALTLKNPSIKRFRDADALALAALVSGRVPVSPAPKDWRRARPDRLAQIGLIPQNQACNLAVGGVSVLGRVTPDCLTSLADLALTANGGAFRLTPWSGVLITDVAAADGPKILAGLMALGFTVDRDAPLAQMVACSGTSGCASALAPTKEDALRLAGLLTGAVDVHLTACPKSCASARVADVTLVAVDADHYDLYRRQDGLDGFGQKHNQGLILAQTAEVLA